MPKKKPKGRPSTLSILLTVKKASWMIKRVNRRLARYQYWTGRGENRGLYENMRQNELYQPMDRVRKIIDFAKRFNQAIDQGDREIGSSVVEWHQLTSWFRKYYGTKI